MLINILDIQKKSIIVIRKEKYFIYIEGQKKKCNKQLGGRFKYVIHLECCYKYVLQEFKISIIKKIVQFSSNIRSSDCYCFYYYYYIMNQIIIIIKSKIFFF